MTQSNPQRAPTKSRTASRRTQPPIDLHELKANLYCCQLVLGQAARRGPGELERLLFDCTDLDDLTLGDLLDAAELPEMEEAEPTQKYALLRKQARVFDQRLRRQDYRCGAPESRLVELARLFDLGACETALVEFAALCRSHHALRRTAGQTFVNNSRQLAAVVADAIGCDPSAVQRSFRSEATLARTGLLTVAVEYHSALDEVFDLRSEVVEALYGDPGAPRDLREVLLHRTPVGTLRRENFSYLAPQVNLAVALLRGALRARQTGVNLLLYGEPGVGKSELARLLIAEVGATAFSVEDTDSEDDPLDSDQRLARLLTTQKLLSSGRDAIILLDEAEELLNSNSGLDFAQMFSRHKFQPKSRKKSWKTRLLEENPVPTLWIANGTDDVDRALLRRFVYTLEMQRPPRAYRLQLLEQAATGVLPPEQLASILKQDAKLTPADIDRAKRVIALTGPETPEEAQHQFRMALATGHRSLRPLAPAAPQPAYCIEWVNATPSVTTLVERLSAVGEGRLCFAGPPGTGKTALAQHIAESLDRPLLRKQASDLLDMYVGQTEQALAAAFVEARMDDAVLLLDEADSFLQNRSGAHQSWEITQVNELLTQIENHNGILILCTNHLEQLDPALLRRVDYKVQFGYLKAGAVEAAFAATVRALGLEADAANAVLAAHPLPAGQIALGDLSAALRQARLRTAQPTAAMLRDCLQAELEARNQGQGRPIGFGREVVA
ncbi:MAG TPA: ATP-binding protein [Nevskiaceae bacterium]|nr:ATP-binding protein [Nevskiaceae bacterium]